MHDRHQQHAQHSPHARYAAGVFRAAGARTVLALGTGDGEDALFLAREGFTVRAVHDVREPLPLPDDSVDAVYAHLLLCMALSTKEIRAAVDELGRVLCPGGLLVYTVRHTGDAHHGTGISHGDHIYEHGGRVVHFFDADLIHDLAKGWRMHGLEAFEEGELPHRLWRVTQARPRVTGARTARRPGSPGSR
ncbi:class I SAM-dependent methyltransferase [Streptomyces spinosisporus]|uniref:Methyltransferase domain-containing protein n=1 Tax=Streptomyces spinosisporus TaxID=2927582 RepID=A0ABS9X800_9ACTN|nr:class I SAM-dependent methyltransferase [Streptomyces spinosisporus]MCI3238186.1 methyltransferase domain-containing protein [Streptomyces spinosisporus]